MSSVKDACVVCPQCKNGLRWISVKDRLPGHGMVAVLWRSPEKIRQNRSIGEYGLGVYDSQEDRWVINTMSTTLNYVVEYWFQLPSQFEVVPEELQNLMDELAAELKKA